LAVRGFDALAKLGAGTPLAEFLPVLKTLGVEKTAPDGTSRIDFRLASAPTKWITINGNDVSAWFVDTEAEPGRPRLLKPMDPPMRGDDVKRVQHALVSAKIPVAQDGAYSPSTAAAVARFQKGIGINANGVVDTETRRRLGVAPDVSRQGGRN
jgi:murein L,D-transpeptidase YcbB/YkuD